MRNDDWLEPDELAGWIHISRRTLDRWRTHGTGPAWHKFGKHVRYHRADVDAWLKTTAADRDDAVRFTVARGAR